MLSRVFKSGNSLAVRIPKELAFAETVEEVEIERKGPALVIRPVDRQGLGGIAKALAAFPAGFMAEGREIHEQKARGWGKGR